MNSVRVYNIDDEEIIDVCFGEDAGVRPVHGLGTDHGELIWDGTANHLPDSGDVLTMEDVDKNVVEYVIICRVFDVDSGYVNIFVHNRHIIDVELD